ncbi:hypothetical protein [Flagellimonas sp.]|uniref:hypothetical protein n=1 Tax=Flagellimonas sp. TaxID=2058762 RepID=UPI003B52E9B1
MFILSSIFGVILGALGSFCVWFYLYRYLVPRIQFSSKISKIVRRGEPIYRVKFNNLAKRNVIDLNITACLHILGLFEAQPNNWKDIYVKLNLNYVPVLRTTTKGGLLANLYINHTNDFSRYPFPKYISEKYEQENLTLEDVFDIGKKVELTFIIMGYDSFSGARKMFESKIYEKRDIVESIFEQHSLDIKKSAPKENQVIGKNIGNQKT